MLLEKLTEYSGRIESTPVMYQPKPIRWVIDLDGEGRFQGFVETSDGKQGKKKDRGKVFLAPNLVRSVGIRAKLLTDKEDYVFGLDKDGKTGGRAIECHAAFKELINRCSEVTGHSAVKAVKAFYETYTPGCVSLPEGFVAGDLFTYRVDSVFPIDLPEVRSFWAEETTGGRGGTTGGMISTCLVCGREKEVVERLPIKIKGIPGGQTSGTSLVSANSSAFESYGLDASHTSPICHECGEGFGKGLNDLLSREDTHITIGQVAYVFWIRGGTDFDILSFLKDPQPEDVKKLLSKPLTGERASMQDEELFYCAAFSASGGRAVVRDWIVTTLGDVQRNLARYFRAQSLIGWDGAEGEPLSVWKMASSLVFKKETLPPNVPKAILRFAFNGGELPMSLIFQAVKRNRAEQALTRPRAALIKMVLMSRKEYLNREDCMEKLDLGNESPAYLCGRLFGVLEAIQKAAMPGVNTTITDRFYGTASTAPASVFGKLMRGSQNHIGKLRRDRRGVCFALEEDLEEVTSRLKTFPTVLNLEQQGLFALGFYHQKANRRAEIEERKAKRQEQAG